MDVDECLVRYGLVPRDENLSAIRRLLSGEAEAAREGREQAEDLALLCAVQLFAKGQVADSLTIWAAKSSSMDLGCNLDVQLLCGAGLEATREYLAGSDEPGAHLALGRIDSCVAAGDFEGFSPEGYLQHYTRYFGVA